MPPWERTIGAFVRITIAADDALVQVAALAECSKTAVVDALLRSLTSDELAALVRVRLLSDEDARAAWTRSTK